MVDLIGWVVGFLSSHPSGLLATLLFVFVVSVAGNLIPFFPTPYLVIVIGVVLDESYLGVIQIAAIAALGAATGKFIWILSVLYVARQSKQIVDQFFGENVYASIVSAALVLSTAYFIVRVDWEKRLLGHKDSLRSRLLGRLRNLLSREQRSDGQGPGQQDKAS